MQETISVVVLFLNTWLIFLKYFLPMNSILRGFIGLAFLLLVLTNNLSAQPSVVATPKSFSEKNIGNAALVEVPFVYNAEKLAKEDALDAKEGLPMRAGFSLPVSISPFTVGEWHYTQDGYRIWRVQISSPDASALGLVFKDFYLPEDGSLFVYNPEKTIVYGAFTSSNNNESRVFSTHVMEGSSLILEYQEPALALSSMESLVALDVSEVVYIYRGFSNNGLQKDLGNSGACEININCSPEGDDWQLQKRSVARIILRQGTSWFYCTGALINNTAYDAKPYFLTADHCGSTSSTADYLVWQFYFNFERSGCANTGTPPNNMMTGAVLKAKGGVSGGTDFKLLELTSDVPSEYQPYYAAWDRSTTGSASGVGIHHPSGDAKKISTYTSALTTTSWSGGMANGHWRVIWAATTNGHGVTEGGSSGSPIFNPQKRIVGTLTGGGASCAFPTAADAYGKFSLHWEANGSNANQRLSPWLDPLNVQPTYMGGYQPGVAPVGPAGSMQALSGGNQIQLSWSLNANQDPVIIAFNTSNTFGTPQLGQAYTSGQTLAGGGSIIYAGIAESFVHEDLLPGTYYYKIWSHNNTFYYSTAQSTNVLLDAFIINLSAQPAAGGNVSGAGTYANGATVEVQATPNTGYTFVNWTEDGTEVSTSSVYSFTATANRNLVANFLINTYTIGVVANPVSGGSVSGGGDFTHGSPVTVSASPAEGYSFVNWTDNGTEVSQNAEYSFTATSSRALTANFVLNSYLIELLVNPTAGGTVSGGGSFSHGTLVSVNAIPGEGYTFVNWSENGTVVSTEAGFSFTALSARVLTANFALNTYNISVSANPAQGGTVSGGGSFSHGDNVSVEAVANTGFSFVHWKEGETVVSTSASYSFVATANRSLTAYFEASQHQISLVAMPSEAGLVSGNGIFSYGQEITVQAQANTGYGFVHWKEGETIVSSDASYTFTVTNDRALTAHFQFETYQVNVMANPVAGGTVSGGGTYNHGQSVTVSALANTGYVFQYWTENGDVVSLNTNYSFSITSDRNLVAHFLINTYTIQVSANPFNGGFVSGGGNYTHGQTVNLLAAPAESHEFVNWTEDGVEVSNEPAYSFTATSSRILVANFEIKSLNIQVSANPVAGGNVSGGGVYVYGNQVTVGATPNTGYNFVNWTENGNVVSSQANYSFTATNHRNLVANFQLKTYNVSVFANPVEAGMVSGGGTYTHGQTVNIHALPYTSYSFINWTSGGQVFSTESSYSFTITGPLSLVANFQVSELTLDISVVGGGTTVPNPGQHLYTFGTQVPLLALPEPGFAFEKWVINGTAFVSNPQTITVVTNSTAVAHFIEVEQYDVNIQVIGQGSTNPAPGNYTYNQGTVLNLSAMPAEGWVFRRWNVNGNYSHSPQIQVAINQNTQITAEFVEAQWFKLNLSIQGQGSVAINPYAEDSLYLIYSQVSLTATPMEGHTFKRWMVNGFQVSVNPVLSLTMNEAKNVTAIFEVIIGVEDYTVQPSFVVYPNPTKGVFRLGMKRDFEAISIQLFNLQGQLLETRTLNEVMAGEEERFDLGALQNGLYIMRLVFDGQIQTFKVSLLR